MKHFNLKYASQWIKCQFTHQVAARLLLVGCTEGCTCRLQKIGVRKADCHATTVLICLQTLNYRGHDKRDIKCCFLCYAVKLRFRGWFTETIATFYEVLYTKSNARQRARRLVGYFMIGSLSDVQMQIRDHCPLFGFIFRPITDFLGVKMSDIKFKIKKMPGFIMLQWHVHCQNYLQYFLCKSV